MNIIKYGVFSEYLNKLRNRSIDLEKETDRIDKDKWNTNFKNKVSTVDIENIPKVDENSFNIVFVTYDGRRHDDFDPGNKKGINDMPFFNSLIKDSIYFDNATATNVWSFPSQSSMFTGLPPQIFRNDSQQDSYHNTFPNISFSISEILGKAGYLNVNIADHPQNLFKSKNGRLVNSFARGFDLIDVVGMYPELKINTNFLSNNKDLQEIDVFKNREYFISSKDVLRISSYNNNEINFREKISFDETPNGLIYPKIDNYYNSSTYFRDRYSHIIEKLFDREDNKPFFMALNLHFCDTAVPDVHLLSSWEIDFLILNAEKLNKKLPEPEKDAPFSQYFRSCLEKVLNLDYWKIKHHFDNRFYDYTFKRLHDVFEEKRISKKTVFVVTSDHGFGFSENGEELYFHGGARPYSYLVDVPLLIKAPESSNLSNLNGNYSERISLTDLFYTIIDIAGFSEILNDKIQIWHKAESKNEMIEELDLKFGDSLIKRIKSNNFQKFIVSELKVKPVYYNKRPYFAGTFSSIHCKNFKLIHCQEAIANFIPQINIKNIKSSFSKDNFLKLVFLLNPLNLLKNRKTAISFLFAEGDETNQIYNKGIEKKCIEFYKDYRSKNELIESFLH